MKLKELEEKIAQLETELAQVKKIAEGLKNKTDNKGVFKPKNKQVYWYILDGDTIRSEWWNNYPVDRDYYEIGNCFSSRESAEDAVRTLRLIQKARELQDGFIPDWEDMLQNKYSVRFFTGDIEISVCQLHNEASMFGYWEHRHACEQFVKDNYEELVWFFSEKR